MSFRAWLVQAVGGLALGASVAHFAPRAIEAAPGARAPADVSHGARDAETAVSTLPSATARDGAALTAFAVPPTAAARPAVLEPRGGKSEAAIGPAYDSDSAMKKHADDVASYTMRAVLDPVTRVVHGDGTIVWRNTSRIAARELFVHLYLNAFKNERTVFLREATGSGGRGTARPSDWGHIDVHKFVAREMESTDLWPSADKTSAGETDDETDVRVPLPREVAPGETLTLEASWDSKLPSVVERTGYANDFFMVGQWFPKIARLEPDGAWRHFPFHHLAEFYADFGTYEVSIDVPAGTIVGATGQRVAFARENGRDKVVYRERDVHDFAFTAWSAFEEKTATEGDVALRILYPPRYAAVAARELDIAAFGLRHFNALYGAYPYRELTLVHPPAFAEEAGGMEYPTLVTTGRPWYDPPFLHDLETLVLHELGHQYFYGLVATDETKWPFLDEGIASFAEAEALAARFGDGAGADLLGYRVGIGARLRFGAGATGHGESIGGEAHDFASAWSYASLVYGRSAAILDTLGGVYGREALLRAIGRYARRYRFEHPTLPDFAATIREVLGDGAAKNLETALFDQGWVDYQVNEATSQPAARAGVEWEGWAIVARQGNLIFPVEIELVGADGSKELAHWDGNGAWTRIPYRGTSELAQVLVDPAIAVTLDANLLNNGLRLTPKTHPHRTLERCAYFAALGLDWLMP